MTDLERNLLMHNQYSSWNSGIHAGRGTEGLLRIFFLLSLDTSVEYFIAYYRSIY